MKEYIKREALPKKKERGFFHNDDFNAGWNACLDAIASIPATDELKFFYADWLCDGYDYERPWVCSKCHYHSESGTNYCPNCGAKMDGGIKNDDNI